MASVIEYLTKVIDGVKKTIYPVTSTAAVIDISGTEQKTQQQINQSLQTQVNAAKEQYHHVTKAWYAAADANTTKSGSVWTAKDPSKDYLHFDAIYVIDDATYGSELRTVIEEMFIWKTKAEYDALVAAGTVNPVAYYFITYPEQED